MAYDTVELVILVAVAFLGLVGGVPQIFSWVKPKPHLKITVAKVDKLPDDYKYQFQVEVENQKSSIKRNSGASHVSYDFFVVDKDSVQKGGAFDQVITQYLLCGFRAEKQAEVFLSLPATGNPYTVVFRVSCKEGKMVEKRVGFEASSVAYS